MKAKRTIGPLGFFYCRNMNSFEVIGGKKLKGEIIPQGAKNEALQIISAVLLTPEKVTITNIPDILDVNLLIELLKEMGVKTERTSPDTCIFQADAVDIDYLRSDSYRQKSGRLRGSVMMAGPMLARYRKAFIPKPGGDKIGRRRLDLPPGGCPGFTIWRRDSIVDVGGFDGNGGAVHADMTFRMHRHHEGDRRRYRIIHVTEPVGTIGHESARRHMVVAGYVPWSVLWRHKGLAFNPRLGRLGLFDFPRYLFNMVVAPYLELLALALLAAAIPLGVLTAGQLLLVLFILGLGSGVVAMCALLLSGDLGRDVRPSALFNVLLVGPLEYFLTRPALLWSRLTSRA